MAQEISDADDGHSDTGRSCPGGGGVRLNLSESDGDIEQGSWEPGRGTGKWVRRGQRLREQGQVLVTNALVTLRKLPRDMLRLLVIALQGTQGATVSLATQAASKSRPAASSGVSTCTGDSALPRKTRSESLQSCRSTANPSFKLTLLYPARLSSFRPNWLT